MNDQPPARITARFDQGDGTDLRHVVSAGVELAARLFFAIRDEHWRTVPLRVLDRHVEETADGFVVAVRGESAWSQLPMTFRLAYRAAGDTLVATCEGEAHAAFRYNRIGFCVLHPAGGSAGRELVVRAADGSSRSARFPHEIAPQHYVDGLPVSLFGAFIGLDTELADGRRLRLDFTGDEFELEDQRNWSDDSFKTYGTPLSLGFPFDGRAGQRFAQSVRCTVEGPLAPPAATAADAPAPPPRIVLGDRIGVLPPVRLRGGSDPAGTWRPTRGFADLNRTPPTPADLADATGVAFGINSSVHADDTWSVLESTATHGAIVAQARALVPSLPLTVGPIDFGSPAGEWQDDDGRVVDPPRSPSTDPRRREPVGAAYVVGSVAAIAGTDPAGLEYLDASAADAAAGRLVAWLGDRAGRTLRAVVTPPGLAALAIDDPAGGLDLAIAVLDSRPVTVLAPDGAELRLDGHEVRILRLP